MLAVDFDKIADAAAKSALKHARWGERDGGNRCIYFPNDTWEELRRRCEERGISVSRYLQTVAAASLIAEE